MTELSWGAEGLSSSIPPEIGDLQKLTTLLLNNNALKGEVPWEIGANLKSLTCLALSTNDLEGRVPFSFVSLTRLKNLSLVGNNKIDSASAPDGHLHDLANTQAYLATLWRPQVKLCVREERSDDTSLFNVSVAYIFITFSSQALRLLKYG